MSRVMDHLLLYENITAELFPLYARLTGVVNLRVFIAAKQEDSIEARWELGSCSVC